MKPAQVAKNIAQNAFEPFEALGSRVAKPIWDEALNELGGFFGATSRLGASPKELAGDDLKRARDQKKLQEETAVDDQKSQEKIQKVMAKINNEYRQQDLRTNREQAPMQEQLAELQGEIASLAKAAGVDTKAHLETMPKKIGVLDIKRLTNIIRFLRIKAEESKSAKEIVSQRSNAKRPTGMLAWVSGKQMKVHEQGTLQLQG